jgi:hypothetical protein
METIYKLPAINELINSDLIQLDETNQLNILLNQTPPVKWLKAHPTATVKENNGNVRPYMYLPIEKVEYLLTRLFFRWNVDVKSVQLIGNSVVVVVTLNYFNPVLNEWEHQDGIGATPLQTDAKAGAIEFDKLKSAAVMMAAPAAESYAIKDAAEKIGAIFGKNLNRADRMSYDVLVDNPAFKKKEVKDLFDEEK